MGFKDDLETDIDSVFLNFDEFSEEIKIGDDIIAGILDEDLYQEKKFKLSEETREVFEEGVTLFVSKKEFLIKPKIGEQLTVNGLKYSVETVKENIGMFEIDLIKVAGK